MFNVKRYITFKRAILCLMIISFSFMQTFPLSAAEVMKIDLSQLDHPAIRLIEKKLKQLQKLSLDENNPKNTKKLIDILVDLKFDLWNQHQIYVSTFDAIDELKDLLKEQGLKDVKKYFKPIKKKLRKEIRRRYKEEEKSSVSIFKSHCNELSTFDRDLQEGESDDEDENIYLISHYETDRHKNKNEPKRYDNCPPSLDFWVTTALVGIVISVLPTAGAFAVGWGLATPALYKCADIILEVKDEEFFYRKKYGKDESNSEEYSDCSFCDNKPCPYHEQRKRERELEEEKNKRKRHR